MLWTKRNIKIPRVGHGAPMGGLIRRYWVPFLEPKELAETDGVPACGRLMGKDLLVFRGTDGKPRFVRYPGLTYNPDWQPRLVNKHA